MRVNKGITKKKLYKRSKKTLKGGNNGNIKNTNILNEYKNEIQDFMKVFENIDVILNIFIISPNSIVFIFFILKQFFLQFIEVDKHYNPVVDSLAVAFVLAFVAFVALRH